MTEHDDTREWDGAHALSGAYAVDALDDVERARFEGHLRTCTDCQIEVETLRETAAALAVDPVEPPARLRAEVLAGIESIRPLPPLIDHELAAPPAQIEGRGRRPWYTSAGPLLVAAALVLVALVTTVALRPWASDDVDLSATERVLQADDRQEVEQRFADGSTATVVVSRSEGRAVIVTEDMALAPAGKVYELWFQTPAGEMVPAGLMPDDQDATVLLEGDATDATGIGITVEPDGGSSTPSKHVVHVFELPA
jgi:anti-sigma-K factor RskA